MNLPDIIAICGPGAASAAPEQRLVYSRDASRIAGQCLAVVWPTVPGRWRSWRPGPAARALTWSRAARAPVCAAAPPRKIRSWSISRA